MILNENQLQIAKMYLENFKESLEELRENGPAENVHPTTHQASIDALCYKINDLRAEIIEYDNETKDSALTKLCAAIELLEECRTQLEYLDEKYPKTGTTANVLSRVTTFLSS
jgi:hypothetical protein